jgi:predicted permease
VTSTVLATEFDADPGFVTSVVFLTTLASVVTVTALLALLL